MKNKNDRKKLLIIVLFLFAIIGVAGYGAYSYYFTRGSFDTNPAYGSEDAENVIRITGEFNPIVEDLGSSASDSAFLGNGGTIELDCPESSDGHEIVECTTSVTVKNEGSTSITVDVSNGRVTATSDDVDVVAGTPSFSWNSTTITAGSSQSLTITAPISVGSTNYGSDDAIEVNSPVDGGSFNAAVSFKLTATQVNND